MFEEMFLKALAGDQAKEEFKSRHDAREELNKFLALESPNIKVNDMVERNDYGKKRYRFPEGNMVAVVTDLLEGVVDSQGETEDIRIMVAISPGLFRSFTANSMFYKVVSEKERGNIFRFRKKEAP